MNAFKAAVLLLITLNLAKAQTGCVPPGSDSDLQLLPGCTSNEILEKVFSGLKKILTEVVGADKEDCLVGLQQIFNETSDFALKCIDGVCNDNLLYQVLGITNPEKITLAELFETYDIGENDLKALLNYPGQYWAEFCPIIEKIEQLNIFKGSMSMELTKVAQIMEQVLEMLMKSVDAYKTKPVGVSNCEFFKNQTSFLMDTIDSISVVNSTISLYQPILQNLPFGSATKLYKMIMKEVKAKLDMIGCSLNSGFLPAVPNIMALVWMIFANFL